MIASIEARTHVPIYSDVNNPSQSGHNSQMLSRASCGNHKVEMIDMIIIAPKRDFANPL